MYIHEESINVGFYHVQDNKYFGWMLCTTFFYIFNFYKIAWEIYFKILQIVAISVLLSGLWASGLSAYPLNLEGT